MKRKLTGFLIAGIIMSQASVTFASDFVGMMPQNLIYTSDVSGGLLAAATDTGVYGNSAEGMGAGGAAGTTGTTGGTGVGGMSDTTGGTVGTTGGTGAGAATGTTGVMGTTGTTGAASGTGGVGGVDSMGTPGQSGTGGYIGNPNNYDPNAVGNTNEIYQNTRAGGANNNTPGGMGRSFDASSFSTILPAGLSNKSQDSGSLFNLDQDTYIVRDGDSLWLVMGQIKAKLEVLIYIDPENTPGGNNRTDTGLDKNSLSNTNTGPNNNTSINTGGQEGLSTYTMPEANENKNAIDNNYYGIPIYK